jgi:phospho-N-acetylmuramoyl-pentapeptide-transferase
LNKTTKVVGQALVAVAFTFVVVTLSHTNTDLSFIRDTELKLGLAFYLWVFVMIAASSNGVNLTDGLDGLASGSAALVLAAYVIIPFWQARHSCIPAPDPACYPIKAVVSLDVAIVAAAALGAVAGFLWWNAAPAKIFMGDTGSLALGGLLAALAVMTDTQLLLLILGGLYALETTSVIVQVAAFRLTGRRVFRMAPLHHHFELLGWPEFTVIVRFWILAGLAVAFGLGLFYADFLAKGGTA